MPIFDLLGFRGYGDCPRTPRTPSPEPPKPVSPKPPPKPPKPSPKPPAGVDSFRIAKEAFAELEKK